MDDHVVHKGSLRIEERRVLRLSNGEPRCIVHRDVLDGGQGSRTGDPDIAHVADVENANAGADGVVLCNDAAHRRVFDRHLPAVEFDHLCTHLAMGVVESSLADDWRSRLNSGQLSLDRSCRWSETLYPNMRVGAGSTARV